MGEIVSLLGAGLLQAFEPLNLGMIIAGCMAGLFIGAMPGLGSVNGVAILLPVTFLVPPTAAIIFLAALYYGAMYGGAISSITLGIPGASTAVGTVFDGRPMAQKGRANQALMAAAVASFIGGTISIDEICNVFVETNAINRIAAFIKFPTVFESDVISVIF